ncbi:MAG: replication-associated recombination protein A [Deltaproteobacteria bacterium]|nr:replication-associated recombination protein A [Deltaproteobacteria bacterium]
MDLFRAAAQAEQRFAPLAERMRPRTLDEVVGQERVLDASSVLRRALNSGHIFSMILWGPPGVGKTSLARCLAGAVNAEVELWSTVSMGVKEIREVVARAEERGALHRQRTVLFLDEIHRFNKAQQDALLPHVEKGTVTLVGATTENPSFEVNAALLSRCRVIVLKPLEVEDLVRVCRRALEDRDRGLGLLALDVDPTALETLAEASMGDARRALTVLEVAAETVGQGGRLDVETVEKALGHRVLLYDKAGEEHFNVVSAFIKSMRGTDPDAAVYYLVRMLEGGEDPRFILRRMVIFASEDVGNADPQALQVAIAALNAFELVGMPEGVLPLTQAVTYLASAPKSNAALTAYTRARKDVVDLGALPVPLKLRNAPTSMMKGLGYGAGYRYPHNFEGNYTPEEYLPDALRGRRYVTPSENGFEATLSKALESARARRK